jgi:hypothetical protein
LATGAFSLGIANVVAPLAISRGALPDGPYSTSVIAIEPTSVESDGVLSNYKDGETQLTPPVLINGVGQIQLSAPGANNTGSVDITNNARSYLPANTARATFGIDKSPLTCRRENY